ncbi:MAG: CotH kinase family protein [Bacteroidales bacterium]|nr:MAG: CotH kinase family protein [Bacteroidales bacterium]
MNKFFSKSVFRLSLLVIICNYFVINELHGMRASAVELDTNNPQITEFMALNTSVLADDDMDYSDWIEIYNPASEPVNLKGWFLTDNSDNRDKWEIPGVILAPDSFLVIFASGKDRADSSKILHTNFKLSGSGEYLALVKPDGITVVSSYGENFPAQYTNISYGVFDDEFVYFNNPTPGAVNVSSTFLTPPVFSVTRGLYNEPFNVDITSSLQDATILYTTNGSTPDQENGEIYTGPVNIKTTTPLRAVALKAGYDTSNIVTHTYIFLDSVLNQPNNPPGYPSTWGPYAQIDDTAIADYEMDPEICKHPDYSGLMIPAFLSIPTISIVTDIDNLFSKDTAADKGGIYIYTGPPTGGLGLGWERPASAEYILPDETEGFHVNCALRLQGGHSRLPEKSPKHSFRLVFTSEYGPSKLNYPLFSEEGATDKFNTITFRGGFCNSWHHWSSYQRVLAQYIRDSWAKDTQHDMNRISAHNNFAHLYLNGLYWGLYNPSERLDREFMESYLGGDEDDYDVIKDYTEVVDGNLDAWNTMMSLANSGLSDDESYQRIQGNSADGTPNAEYENLLDVENLIDYIIVNFYGGNTDWDHHNWAAARNRIEPGKGFRFFSWDAEHILEDLSTNVTSMNNDNCPSRLFQKLRENDEFRLLFADHVNLHFFNGGVLTPEAAAERWMKRAEEIDLAVICESARWGDYRRDVHQYRSKPYYLYTKNDFWLIEQERLINEYFPERTQVVLNQFKNNGLYPEIEAPVFNKHGGEIYPGFNLEMSCTSGKIYYTLNNTDPRITGGDISTDAIAYNAAPVIINNDITVKARTRNGSSWSALTAADFTIDYIMGIEQAKLKDKKEISRCFPNPFSDFTTIFYNLQEAGNIEISIFSVDGRLITTLFSGYHQAGSYSIVWRPSELESGVYFYIISSNQLRETGKLMFIK